MPTSEPFSLRLPQELYDRLFSVIAATGNEVTRTGVITKALETYFAILDRNPSLVSEYDRAKDKSVTHYGEL